MMWMLLCRKILAELNQLILPYLAEHLCEFHGQIEKGDRIAIVGKKMAVVNLYC
nr:hypothetical protein [Escherichia coli]